MSCLISKIFVYARNSSFCVLSLVCMMQASHDPAWRSRRGATCHDTNDIYTNGFALNVQLQLGSSRVKTCLSPPTCLGLVRHVYNCKKFLREEKFLQSYRGWKSSNFRQSAFKSSKVSTQTLSDFDELLKFPDYPDQNFITKYHSRKLRGKVNIHQFLVI